MKPTLEPTADPAWVLQADGYDALRETTIESRFAISNGFLGIRGARAVTRPLLRTIAACAVASSHAVSSLMTVTVASRVQPRPAAPGGAAGSVRPRRTRS